MKTKDAEITLVLNTKGIHPTAEQLPTYIKAYKAGRDAALTFIKLTRTCPNLTEKIENFKPSAKTPEKPFRLGLEVALQSKLDEIKNNIQGEFAYFQSGLNQPDVIVIKDEDTLVQPNTTHTSLIPPAQVIVIANTQEASQLNSQNSNHKKRTREVSNDETGSNKIQRKNTVDDDNTLIHDTSIIFNNFKELICKKDNMDSLINLYHALENALSQGDSKKNKLDNTIKEIIKENTKEKNDETKNLFEKIGKFYIDRINAKKQSSNKLLLLKAYSDFYHSNGKPKIDGIFDFYQPENTEFEKNLAEEVTLILENELSPEIIRNRAYDIKSYYFRVGKKVTDNFYYKNKNNIDNGKKKDISKKMMTFLKEEKEFSINQIKTMFKYFIERKIFSLGKDYKNVLQKLEYFQENGAPQDPRMAILIGKTNKNINPLNTQTNPSNTPPNFPPDQPITKDYPNAIEPMSKPLTPPVITFAFEPSQEFEDFQGFEFPQEFEFPAFDEFCGLLENENDTIINPSPAPSEKNQPQQ